MRRLTGLRNRIHRVEPLHDSPIGLIHPYWARKPLNIVVEVISALSEPGDTVADPFVGSGTVALGALSLGRHAIACDINPLAILIVRAIVGLTNETRATVRRLRDLSDTWTAKALPWYQVDSSWYVERERFTVSGDYAQGNFRLTPIEYVLRRFQNGAFTGRKVASASDVSYINYPEEHLLDSPLDFSQLNLAHNPRIAIPEGARLSHFFTARNTAFINLALQTINALNAGDPIKPILQTLLSSALPLLRLSDRKGSSQWPYWRPKVSLTSRNPVVALGLRMRGFARAAKWAEDHLNDVHLLDAPAFYSARRSPGMLLQNTPVQSIFENGIRRQSADLVLTDPPYSDQAPYLEYSQMSNRVVGLDRGDLWSSEIVKTDAPSRIADAAAYIERLSVGIEHCCDLVRQGGFLALFYQDRRTAHWAAIWKVITDRGLVICDVLAIPKQRRSMKTVTAPGRTFDGDLLVICYKPLGGEDPCSASPGILQRECVDSVDLDAILQSVSSEPSYFERYAEFVKIVLVQGSIEEVSRQIRDVAEVLQ